MKRCVFPLLFVLAQTTAAGTLLSAAISRILPPIAGSTRRFLASRVLDDMKQSVGLDRLYLLGPPEVVARPDHQENDDRNQAVAEMTFSSERSR